MQKFSFILFLLFAIPSYVNAQEQNLIGLCMSDLQLERWNKDHDQLIEHARKAGYKMLIRDADKNAETQEKQAEELIGLGAKLLIVIAVDGNKAAIIVDKAHQAGIKVLAYDRMIMNCDLDAYVSFDNQLVGEFMAIYILNYYPKKKYAYIGGPTSDINTSYVHKGILESLSNSIERGNTSLVLDTNVNEWKESCAYSLMGNYLNSKRPMPDIVFAGNDALAAGVIKALDEAKQSGKIKVVGQDADLAACRSIVKGYQLLTIYKPIRNLAEIAIKTADEMIQGKPLSFYNTIFNGKKNVPSFLYNPVPVTIDNIRETIILDGYQKEEEVFK
jgi:D-xylose transport system substrate-binding protein